MRIHVRNGLVYEDEAQKRVCGVQFVDNIARANGFAWAEQFVKAHDGEFLTIHDETYVIRKEGETCQAPPIV